MSLQSSCNSRANMRQVGRKKLGKTKIWYPGSKIFVEENITGFNVSMNNMRLNILMKVS